MKSFINRDMPAIPAVNPNLDMPTGKKALIAFDTNARELRKLLGLIEAISDEVKFTATKAGKRIVVQAKGVDPAHVSMVELLLTTEFFDNTLRISKQCEVGIPIGKLKSYFIKKYIPDTTKIRIVITEHLIHVKFQFEPYTIVKKFKTVCVEGMSDPQIPNLFLPFVIPNLDIWELKRVLEITYREKVSTSDYIIVCARKVDDNTAKAFFLDKNDAGYYAGRTSHYFTPTQIGIEADVVPLSMEHFRKTPLLTKDEITKKMEMFKNSIRKAKKIFKDGKPGDIIMRGLYNEKLISGFLDTLCKVTHTASLYFHSDWPIEIRFEADGLMGFYLLAPRIESD